MSTVIKTIINSSQLYFMSSMCAFLSARPNFIKHLKPLKYACQVESWVDFKHW